MHENVPFHDGTKCDAAAVKGNFDQLLAQGKKTWINVYFDQNEASPAASYGGIKRKGTLNS